MSKRFISVVVTMITATVLFIAGAMSDNSNDMGGNKKNTVECPDFAFPQTVIENADKALSESLSDGDSIKIVKALIQIAAASGDISDSKLPDVLQKIDSIASGQTSAVRSLLYLSEAMIYSSVYNQNRLTYDRRNLPIDEMSSDFTAWSKDMFAIKILELSKLALANESELIAMSSTDFQELYKKNNTPWQSFYPTMYDVVAYNLLGMIEDFVDFDAIPFVQESVKISVADEIKEFCAQTLAKIENIHLEGDYVGASIIAQINPIISDNDRVVQLLELLEKYSESEYSAELIFELNNYIGEEYLADDAYYNLCNDYIEHFPQSYASESIKKIIERYDAPLLNVISIKGRFLSDENISTTVQVRNLNKFYVKIFSVDVPYMIANRNDWDRAEKKLVKTETIVVDKSALRNDLKTIDLGSLDYGRYSMCVVAEKNEIPDWYNNYEHFVVTDTETLVVTDHRRSRRLYVIDARDGRPIDGAKVEFLKDLKDESHLSTDKIKYQAVTDKDGSIGFNLKQNGKYRVTRGNDVLHGDTDIHYLKHKRDKEEHKIFTNLAIYHPGDTVKFSVLAYEKKGNSFHLKENKKIAIQLIEANGKSIDKLTLTTDEDGRADGFFKLPEDGLHGRFMLRTDCAFCGIRVEDYKAPGFYVEVDKTNSDITAGDKFVVRGSVKTYSGMALPAASIKYDIHYFGWWRASQDATFAGETTADADGRFAIELQTDMLKGTRFAFGTYQLIVHATSESGETQDSEPVRFFMGKNYTIIIEDYNSNGLLCTDSEEVSMNVSVKSMLGESLSKEVAYELVGLDNTKRKYTGVFTSPMFKMSTKGVPSGKYHLTFSLLSDTTVSQDMEVIIYRNKDKRPPFVTPLWVTDKTIVARHGDEYCDVTISSSFKDSQVLCVISNTSKILFSSWETIKDFKKTLKIPVPEDNDKVTVHLYAFRNGEFYQEGISVLPATSADKLVIETTSFRDKLIPNSSETWKFKFKYADKPSAYVPALASMTDKSLNAIEQYSWHFAPNIILQDAVDAKKMNWHYNHGYIQNSFLNFYDSVLKLPELDFYERLYLYGRKNRAFAVAESYYMTCPSSAVVAESASEEIFSDDVAYGAADSKSLANNNVDEPEQRIEYRETACPTAFFYPNLKSDENGEFEISFDVPNFNTTWQFQLLGYTDQLKTSILREDIVANKPIMVKSNLPRFVRTGDNVTLKALLFNNTDTTAIVGGRIELFNPCGDEVLMSKVIGQEEISVNGQRIVSVDYLVPDNLPFVGFRIYASSGSFTDGEQSLLAVLPSSSSVVESEMFYMKAEENEKVIQMPDVPDNARLTFTFCDNPIWHCVTALPDIITPQSDNIFSLLSAFYGNAVSDGLTREYPQIREALAMLFKSGHNENDLSLISPLQKDLDLKVVELNNTTWLQDAEYETLRMSRLNTLLDTVNSRKLIREIVNRIEKLQASNGGMKWNQMSYESLYPTGQTLLHLAMLCDMGYLPDEPAITKIISKATGYIDSTFLAEKQKNKKVSTLWALDYLYIRSFFKKTYDNTPFDKLRIESLKSIIKEWRKFDIYNKATAAILLHREGFEAEAKYILESLRQFALKTEHQGCYYDNIGSGWSGFDRLITTTQVLEAFAELSPNDDIIDELRQWLLVQRQAQEWRSPRHHVEVMHAIFTTGSDWTKSHRHAQVWVGGKLYQPSEYEQLTGSFTINIDADNDNEINVSTDGKHPSWGGLTAQYIAPMSMVKAASVEALSIDKKLYVIEEESGATHLKETEHLKVGQRVRVQFIITSDRDLEYVALIDERASFMEPIEQTSHYQYDDGIGYYREVRNSNTNIFIDFLPKGTHVISYDCFVSQEGEFSLGIATIQSQYAPLITAHSDGQLYKVEK